MDSVTLESRGRDPTPGFRGGRAGQQPRSSRLYVPEVEVRRGATAGRPRLPAAPGGYFQEAPSAPEVLTPWPGSPGHWTRTLMAAAALAVVQNVTTPFASAQADLR